MSGLNGVPIFQWGGGNGSAFLLERFREGNVPFEGKRTSLSTNLTNLGVALFFICLRGILVSIYIGGKTQQLVSVPTLRFVISGKDQVKSFAKVPGIPSSSCKSALPSVGQDLSPFLSVCRGFFVVSTKVTLWLVPKGKAKAQSEEVPFFPLTEIVLRSAGAVSNLRKARY